MSPTPLLISGLPGRMAREVALLAREDANQEKYELLGSALTGEGVDQASQDVAGHTMQLLKPSERDGLEIPPGLVAVDFTEPTVALDNVKWFTEREIPFVMGTTGYDFEAARRLVESSPVTAVIAPNMATPIILIQSAVHYLAARFPGALAGYRFHLTESHQQGKKDTSGTAKALVGDFERLGLPATVDGIEMIRDPQEQATRLNVPEEHIRGHAYHYYEAETPGGAMRVGLSHCVNGRRVYAEGALVAVDFLRRRLAEGIRGRVYNMISVLEDMQPEN